MILLFCFESGAREEDSLGTRANRNGQEGVNLLLGSPFPFARYSGKHRERRVSIEVLRRMGVRRRRDVVARFLWLLNGEM